MSDPARRPDAPHRLQLWIVIGGLVISVGVAGSAIAFVLLQQGHPTGSTGPSAFAPMSIASTAPGSLGCRAFPGNICYLTEVDCSIPDLSASNLFFAVNNTSPISYPETRSVGLGPGASVTLLRDNSTWGVWNYSQEAWDVWPAGVLPDDGSFAVVLDSGLGSNLTLAAAYFFVEHSYPSGGSVGFTLS